MALGIRIAEFDTWRPGYGLANVRVERAGTSDLADIFLDQALTQAAENPQTLLEHVVSGIHYGKWSAPLYTEQHYELKINSVDQTGVTRVPVLTLAAADASLATVQTDTGSQDITLAAHLGRVIDVRDYGEFKAVGVSGASSSTNNATVVAAIGAASARGGGEVKLPAGTYALTQFTVPQNVVLEGVSRTATILQSTAGAAIATIGGDRAGFRSLTLDGVSLVAASIAVYARQRQRVVFDDVEIKRFNRGIDAKGHSRCQWRDLHISNCVDGYRCYGDDDSGLGGEATNNRWRGGSVSLCTGTGIEIKHVDEAAEYHHFHDVAFSDNATAVAIVGARQITFVECDWLDNTVNLAISDGTPEALDNTVRSVEFEGGSIQDGAVNLIGELDSVAFRRMDIGGVTFTLTTPGNNVIAQDCHLDTDVVFSGVSTSFLQRRSHERGVASVTTTGATPKKAWAMTIEPGECVLLIAKVLGRQRNSPGNRGYYFFTTPARRPTAGLAYDTQTGNFTTGRTLTGATSGATATIVADTDAGATGTLALQNIVGEFVDNEAITDDNIGAAIANGGLTFSNVLIETSVTDLVAPAETDNTWAATFVVNGPQIEVRVTGATSQTIDWIVDVEVMVNPP